MLSGRGRVYYGDGIILLVHELSRSPVANFRSSSLNPYIRTYFVRADNQ